MPDPEAFWLGLQRERTGLAWTRTLEALTAAQVVVAVDGLRTHRVGPALVGLLLLAITVRLMWWQYRTPDHEHGNGFTNPAERLAIACAALGMLAVGGVLMVLT
jgi:uncharacterized membrane protein YidH (DUF202 family)